MDRSALLKWVILVVAMVFSIVLVVPPGKKVRLGLDLQGGTSFAVVVDHEALREDVVSRNPNATPEQIEDEIRNTLDGAQERSLEVIRNRVDVLGISEPVIYPGKGGRIVVQLPGVGEEKRKLAEDSVEKLAFLEFRVVHEKNDDLVRKLTDANKTPEGYRVVRMENTVYLARDSAYEAASRAPDYRARLGRFEAPPGYEFMLEERKVQAQTLYRPAFVNRKRELTGQYLKNAAVDYVGMNQPVVDLTFDGRGAKLFGSITAAYAPGGSKNPNQTRGRQLAIVLDGKLYSAPEIKEPIYGGKAQISGSFTLQQATFLKNVLRAGSLPAPVKIIEKRFVAATLGSDAIHSGRNAVLYTGIGVVLFMLLYYRVAGMVANVALMLNLLLMPFGMVLAAGFLSIFAKDAAGGSLMQLPVLTLPGIAGIVLTIGMAVDANILIFERIREELGAGKRLWTSIEAGYDRAFTAILDSNLTTVLSAVILFVFGSGPIRGFAVTLTGGILVSMFTALTVTKLVFGVVTSNTKLSTLTMTQWVKQTSVDFVSKRGIAITVSILVIVGSWGYMVFRGIQDPSSVLAVDFTGGSAVTFTFQKEVPPEDVRARLAEAGVADATIQYQGEGQGGRFSLLQVRTGNTLVNQRSQAEIVREVLIQKMPEAGFAVAQEDDVGSQVGREITRRTIWALVLSLVGMILYISIRFEFGFALGAIVALIHDVLVTAGVYAVCGRQISLPIIAALLTIIGYSVNDTIVIFDRVRENLRLIPNKTFPEICNLSMNQTLSRTLLTSFTVLISVLVLLLVGGGEVNDFALAMFIGLIAGTYSTVYIATPVVLFWHRDRRPDFATKRTT